jgi:hypothetical protein
VGMYKRCMHVERLDTEEYEGLLDNERIFVAAKVDRLNGCSWRDEGAEHLTCGPHNYELTVPGAEDNIGFRSWCGPEGAEQDALRAFCGAHPDLVMYGEWMGQRRFTGAFKGHDRCALSMFSSSMRSTAKAILIFQTMSDSLCSRRHAFLVSALHGGVPMRESAGRLLSAGFGI